MKLTQKSRSIGLLTGKTITKVEVVDYDLLGNGDRVDELYRVTCSDGTILHLLCDGGDCCHYGTMKETEVDEDGTVHDGYGEGEYMGSFEEFVEVEEEETK